MTTMHGAEKKAAHRVGALMGAAALMLASCATDSDSEPLTKFESGRHGYAMDLPEKLGLGEDCPLVTDSDVVAGEPARTGTNECHGMTVGGRSLAHVGRGYYFTTDYPSGDSAAESALDGIVASIRFVDQ